MVARPNIIFGDDMEDSITGACSPPPSDLIVRLTSSFCIRHAKKFSVATHPCLMTTSSVADYDQVVFEIMFQDS
jgi:hypothetical protein